MNPRLVRLARKIDLVWKVLSRLRSSKALPMPLSEPRSILVIDLHLVGDMVMLLPLLKALRTRFPHAKISVLAGPWASDIIAGCGDWDDLIQYTAPWVKPQPRWRAIVGFTRIARRLSRVSWDLGIDVRGDVRQILMLWLAGCNRRVGFDFTGGRSLLTDVVPDDGNLHHILDHHERIAAYVGAWDGRPFVPRIGITGEERQSAQSIVPFVGFHPGASLPLRRLSAADTATLIVLHSQTTDRLILFSANDLEDYTAEVLALLAPGVAARVEVWRGSLRSFIVTSSRATRMFTMDSGPAHISAALDRETVVFFGPNLPAYTAPRGPNVRVVEDTAVPCRPCDQKHCINPVRQACMRGLVDRYEGTGHHSVARAS